MRNRFRNIISTFVSNYEIKVRKRKRSKKGEIVLKKIFQQIALQGMGANVVEAILQNIQADGNFEGWKTNYLTKPEGQKM